MLPRFLPDLPKREQDRLEAIVEREALRFWKGFERPNKAKRSLTVDGRKRTIVTTRTGSRTFLRHM
jgi:hypothetical protein